MDFNTDQKVPISELYRDSIIGENADQEYVEDKVFLILHDFSQDFFAWKDVKTALEAFGKKVKLIVFPGNEEEISSMSQPDLYAYIRTIVIAIMVERKRVVLVCHHVTETIISPISVMIPDLIDQFIIIGRKPSDSRPLLQHDQISIKSRSTDCNKNLQQTEPNTKLVDLKKGCGENYHSGCDFKHRSGPGVRSKLSVTKAKFGFRDSYFLHLNQDDKPESYAKHVPSDRSPDILFDTSAEVLTAYLLKLSR